MSENVATKFRLLNTKFISSEFYFGILSYYITFELLIIAMPLRFFNGFL